MLPLYKKARANSPIINPLSRVPDPTRTLLTSSMWL